MTVEFFYMSTSYYSQKARLSLEEKGIPYKGIFISLLDNEQNQPWYLNVNPNGEVPTLKIGDECFPESEKIIDIVDKLPSDSESKLIPDIDTAEGKLVAEWRQRFIDLPIGNMTYGVATNPELSTDGLSSMPTSFRPTKEGTRKRFEKSINEMKEAIVKNPELRSSYERKINLYDERIESFFSKDKTSQILDNMESFLDDVEKQLSKMSSEHGGEYWMCGKTFTVVDLNLCVLLGRLRFIGVLPRYAIPQRPTLVKYWQRVQTRPSVKKVCLDYLAEAKRYYLCRKARRVGGVLIGVGVAALAVWMMCKHVSK